MIIKKITLENIRSYINQELELPEGSILFSGDVGSGKSTILLAVEFALFGISKGYLSGSSLLRNGKDKGSVTLNLKVNNKDVSIKRTLKRIGENVSQDSGFIIINGKKYELSAMELKQAILELLNYPKDSLTKSKSLIFRYTVYTPQEEMKHILIGDNDTRLNILRKVFGIDKYKLIKENAKILLAYFKEKRKEYEALISSLPEKESERSNTKDSISKLEKEFNEIYPVLDTTKKRLAVKAKELDNIELTIKQYNNLKNELGLVAYALKEQKNDLSRNESDLNLAVASIEHIEKIDVSYFEKIKSELSEKQNQLDAIEDSLKEVSYNISAYDANIRNSEKIKKDIFSLDKCPLCKQEVTETHKSNIIKIEEDNIIAYKNEKKELLKKEASIKLSLQSIKKSISELEKRIVDFRLAEIKTKNNKDKEDQMSRISYRISELKLSIRKLLGKQKELEASLSNMKDNESEYNSIKKEIETLYNNNTRLEVQVSVIKSKISHFGLILEKIEREIEKQSLIKNKLYDLITLQNWLDSSFINLVVNIEKHMMLKINADFNQLFDGWFKILMDSENINIRLDENFSPLIDQNGFTIDYENLSGGEKTAAALAYRLALNQVINTLVSSINTRDLIILDEPTDGFSEDQLDRIRLVLNELNMRQTIIVSHESKIESFVDTIIRLSKENHISQIIP